MKECKTCEFFESIGNVGNCHRFPPNQDGQGLVTVDEQPVVKETGWCGEHKRKDKK